MTEDPDFTVAATCVRYGMGSWSEVMALSEEERLAFYYHCARAEGCKIDWSTGRIWHE